jgi:hypothetical protein
MAQVAFEIQLQEAEAVVEGIVKTKVSAFLAFYRPMLILGGERSDDEGLQRWGGSYEMGESESGSVETGRS